VLAPVRSQQHAVPVRDLIDRRERGAALMEHDVDLEFTQRALDQVAKRHLVGEGGLAGLDLEMEIEIPALEMIVNARAEHPHGRPLAEDSARRLSDGLNFPGLETRGRILDRCPDSGKVRLVAPPGVAVDLASSGIRLAARSIGANP
jgi:hypothetical protein